MEIFDRIRDIEKEASLPLMVVVSENEYLRTCSQVKESAIFDNKIIKLNDNTYIIAPMRITEL